MARLVKNPPAIQETWVRSLGWEDLEKGKAPHSSILAWRIPWTVSSWRRKELEMTVRLSLHFLLIVNSKLVIVSVLLIRPRL